MTRRQTIDSGPPAAEIARVVTETPVAREREMKDSSSTAKQLLDVPYAPEAEAFLDELERSGQFRIGLEAELDDAEPGDTPSNDYAWGRGSGHVSVSDWWTTGRVALRINPGLVPADVVLARVNDALVVRTHDGLDRVTLEGYLGLIPDASTLRILFADGTEWAGADLLKHVAVSLVSVQPADDSAAS